jgi:hypothetical protein
VCESSLRRSTHARALPEHAIQQWNALPFQVAEGGLFLAGPEPPRIDLNDALKSFMALEVRFHLVTPTEYRALADRLL